MQNTLLNYQDRRNLAIKAIMVRIGKQAKFLKNADIKRLLFTRRNEDKLEDLYTVFNRIQENIMQGRINYILLQENGEYKSSSLRRIKKGSDTDIKFNSGFWNEAMKYVA